jgi:diguanylate cyclase (GGDEF)-like protein
MMDETRGVAAPATASRDTWFWRPLLALCVLAVAAVFSGTATYVQVSWLSTALNFYSVLAYAATSTLLLSTLRVDARRSIVVLAATAAGMATLAGLTTISLPMAPALPSILVAGAQSGPWLYVFQYLAATGGALIYALYRRDDAAAAPSGRTVVAYVAGTVAVIGAIALAALILAGTLPVLTVAGGFTGLRSSWLFYGHAVLAAVAILAIARLRDRDDIDRAVLLSVIAIVLIDVVLIFHVQRYTAGYLIVRILSGASATFVLLAAMRRVVKAYEQLPIMQATLDRTERLAVRQSDRLTAVWRLVSDADIDEELRVQAILDAGASALRPGHAFFGTLRRVENDEDLVVELVSEAFKTGPEQSRRFARNDRIKLETVFAADIIAAGRTIAFSDYGNDIGPALRQKRHNSSNWKGVIGTSFVVANTRYVLSFAAFETMEDEPFTDDDLAFIDVLASFIASKLHHGRQLAQIRYQIDHDALTGLPTRSSFRAAAARLISAEIPCAIAVIDLDRFREVNETFGHMLGDAMLVEIAAGLTGARRGGELVARIGGDNFGVLLDGVTSAVDVEARLQAYRGVFERPLLTGDRTGREALFVGASVGVALFPQDAAAFADLLAGADSAVDVAKERQRGSLAFYNQESEATVQRRRTMRLELANAIDNGQLELHYLPTLELAGGTVAGVEGLVRWEHPILGSVGPDEFIPMAENNTLIRPVGRWVFRQALADITALGRLPDSFRCFLNLSGLQLGVPEFLAALRMHLAEQPAAFHHIGVDINESVAMHQADRTLDVMAVLRELGIEIALDDFGTGHSALSYVTRFPLNIIKIDRRFIQRLPGTAHDEALVEVLLGIAQRFGFRTHAEGIETAEQYEWLRQRGCAYGSGFYIARPMRFDALRTYLKGARLTQDRPVFAIQPRV